MGRGQFLRERGHDRMGGYPERCRLWEQKGAVIEIYFINASWPPVCKAVFQVRSGLIFSVKGQMIKFRLFWPHTVSLAFFFVCFCNYLKTKI